MSKQKLIAGPVEGYKILNDDLTCRDFKFDITPGAINELPNDRELELCGNGFHFCKQPSGVWSYYNYGRVFKAKAYDVLDAPEEPGADYKLVCRRIEFVEELIIGGNGNTGDYNTGNWNTGDRNTGYYNTGDRNTGNGNTGNGNTGNRNTGDGNVGTRHSGGLCYGEAPHYLFNKIVEGGIKAVDGELVVQLAYHLSKDAPIDPTPFLVLPNASKKAIKDLHKAHIKARKELKNGDCVYIKACQTPFPL